MSLGSVQSFSWHIASLKSTSLCANSFLVNLVKDYSVKKYLYLTRDASSNISSHRMPISIDAYIYID